MALSVALLLAAGVGVAIFSSQILGLYGPGFVQAGPLLLIMMAAALFEGVSTGMYQVIQSRERMWASFIWIALPRDSSVVILALWLVPAYGSIGLAIAYAAAMALGCLATCTMALRLQPELFRRRADYGALP
jgi:O-antigen/teichoic acid export membrane protein